MMLKTLTPCLLALAMCAGADANAMNLTWDKLPPLPPSAGQAKQPGVAGPFAGVHGDALIVAGGANFPEKLPWEGGAKIWWNDVWVLEGLSGEAPRWVTDKAFTLPRRMGYGISVDTPEGVIFAGGHDAERCYADVYLVSWDAKARAVKRTELPAMPEPLSFMAGALVGQTLFVAGGQTAMKGADAVASKAFWALDLAKRGAERKWQVLPSWPGPARVLPVAAAAPAKDGNGQEFFLSSGRLPEPGKPTRILSDAYAFDPKTRQWRVLPPVGDGVRAGLSAMAGAAAAVGDEVWIFGGDRGEKFLELEAHDLAIAELRAAGAADAEAVITARLEAKNRIYAAHPGFAREVLAFNAKTNAWRVAGRVPAGMAPQVTTVAVKRGGEILLPSGEIKPGIRTTDVVRVRVEEQGER